MSEVEQAQEPRIPLDGEDTLFDRIARKEIQADIVYEDHLSLAFRDIAPQAPTHIVIIPKDRKGLTSLHVAGEGHKDLLGHLVWVTAEVARRLGLSEGWRLVINNGKYGAQSVYHLHIHLLGGRQMNWPPG